LTLSSIDLDKTRSEIEKAVKYEIPKLENLRAKTFDLNIQELKYRQRYAIAPVATDGGQNRISFEPLNIEIIRVVDSDGTEHIQKVVPLSMDTEYIRNLFKDDPILMQFLEIMDIEYPELFYVPLHSEDENGPLEIQRNRLIIRNLREIFEWAVLMDMAYNPGRVKILLLRDGLLRLFGHKREVVKKLAKAFEDAYKENDVLLLGVAKKSKILNYLSLSLSLGKTFDRDYPCFCEVPEEVEKECYKFSDWMKGRSFGQLHLVKLSKLRETPVIPIDVPLWLTDRRKEILEYLAEVSKDTFPRIGYPFPLLKAHENAVLRGLEMDIMADYLVDSLVGLHEDPEEKERIINQFVFGRGLIKGGFE
jgi:hypothetical protein